MLSGIKQQPVGLIDVSPFSPSSQDLSDADSGLSVPAEPGVQTERATESRQIDQLLATGFPWLRFPGALEARFQQDCAEQRLRALMINGVLVGVMFNWMLISDWSMVPDVFDTALTLRLFVFTPATIASLFVLRLVPSPFFREWSTFVWGLGASAINLYVCISSHDAYAPSYLLAFVPIVVFANSVSRMRFFPALLMDLVVLGMYAKGVSSFPDQSLPVMIPASLVMISAIVFTLYGCYTLERDERQNWLLHLRESLLQQELAQANAHLDALSRSDMLTELANRRHFDEYLQQVWEHARQDGSEISLMMVDVDHFRAYNERYGHPEGDACLQEIAAMLKRRLRRPGDLIARFGGEEFIAILSGTPLATAASAAERVRQGVESLNRVHATSPTQSVITVSIGVSCLRPNAPHASAAQLISAADEALYQAKSRGRNRVFAFGTHV